VLSGESILCFAPDPWDDIWRNRHQIMSLLARQNRVVYVEPRPYFRQVIGELGNALRYPHTANGTSILRGPRVRRIAEAGGRSLAGDGQHGLWVYRPPWYAPLSGRAPLSLLTSAIRDGSLRASLRRLGIETPILWLFRPEMADLPGRYGERLLIYHIVDEYTGYADMDPSRAEDIRQRERALIARADLVLVTSRALLEAKGGLNPNIHWVPNGVDYERFAQAAAQAETPGELRGLSHPLIGYVGAINDKIDVTLLGRVADAFPEGTLVLAGPLRVRSSDAQRGLASLRSRPNVRLIGMLPVERVPGVMASCDVGLLPYRQNEWTRHIHPLKLYEYLACGLPVVATDIPSVRDEGALVYLSADADGFVSAVGQALIEDGAALREARRARAAQNTWSQRVERISELIQATQARKDGTRDAVGQ